MEPERIVLFDGVCNVCSAGVDFLLRRDREGRLRFASLQGETAARLRAAHPEIPAEVETMALVERGAAGERVYLRSEAVLRTLAALGGLWRVLL
ncbi:MAG: DCC1-like thiol-disulfide oxidoreductase family protein, partial [Candidatus Methylomirabilis sp.]|nr:DCC1-like thiol-disulfide oxidoreductase family protein [Deltaproteobacteria bacterium]